MFVNINLKNVKRKLHLSKFGTKWILFYAQRVNKFVKKALMCEYLNGSISLNNICGPKLSDYKTCQWFKMNSRKTFEEIQEHYLEHIEIVFILWPLRVSGF